MITHDARRLAERHLAGPLPLRWSHVQGVAVRAEHVAAVLEEPATVLVSAAWLHDIGYAPPLAWTGFHPLDGARYLRRIGVEERVVRLVAHHSAALLEAEERGLADDLVSEFPCEISPTADALWYCDLTTGPEGQQMTLEARLTEIKDRYGAGHLVTRFIERASPELTAAISRTGGRLRRAGVDPNA